MLDQSAGETPPDLAALLGLKNGPPAAKCVYAIAGAGAARPQIELAAQVVAEDAMRHRCGASPMLEWWRARHAGGPSHSPQRRQALEAFVQDTFGVPGVPGDPEQLQGYVAELIWHRLASERVTPGDGRTLVHVADLSWSVYQQGGDGLVVYQVAEGQLVFRLWEVKKHESTAHLSRTVGRACKQLSNNALRYLAQFTAYGSKLPDDLGHLFANLVPLWLDEDPRAGVGVSVATSAQHTPKRAAFGGVATAFPRFSQAQREGLVVVVDDFSAFATTVRDIVWTGL